MVIFGHIGQPYSWYPSLIGSVCKIIKDKATVWWEKQSFFILETHNQGFYEYFWYVYADY